MSNITLRLESVLMPQVRNLLDRVSTQIRLMLPEAEIEHIGATSIPGALTKGDLDIMVRVSTSQFHAALVKLQASFQVKQLENWSESFASFGDDTGYALPLGIQLVVRHSDSDFLLFLRDHLIRHPEALDAYNQLKLRHATEGSEAYWKAKHLFFAAILATRPT